MSSPVLTGQIPPGGGERVEVQRGALSAPPFALNHYDLSADFRRAVDQRFLYGVDSTTTIPSPAAISWAFLLPDFATPRGSEQPVLVTRMGSDASRSESN
ncbi:hypothetical protein SMCB_1994 [Serpentinimonas maccroryi]|uniref:Uncharacterized protein n=1 Tax=Serpentinimonas maccroryi TaxID=1458426 RepID=A0A060NR22_9BURK|nr:hypothetical protein SMCB_1994 [Serpentinimonas maccroryi]